MTWNLSLPCWLTYGSKGLSMMLVGATSSEGISPNCTKRIFSASCRNTENVDDEYFGTQEVLFDGMLKRRGYCKDL